MTRRLSLGSRWVGTSFNLYIPGIEVEQGTMSGTITLDTIKIDVDQLRLSDDVTQEIIVDR